MKAVLAILVVLVVGACGVANIRSDASDQEVRAQLGNPRAIFPIKGGGTSWEYPRGPEGLETVLVQFDAGGRLISVEQVLTDANVNRIVAGSMSDADVRALIGPPWRTIEFDNIGQTAWDYRYRDTWGYRVELSVMVDKKTGLVAGKVARRLDDMRDTNK